MKIEKIELNGFKSFVDRTTFNLHSGITCIVGPNGCGKSNIVDAFRWVLGEQSAKTLRGGKMEEVIFNGSTVKKPKGMAHVTLHISGISGAPEGNGDSKDDTITVSRRLYRSGESEYLINNNICRLKDIRDLFLDTGLEVKSYSIIEQGHIDEILNSKAHERRFLIEEVAGVMKYNVRKAEAQNKLESSRLNLQRVNDIISEVKKQINTLNRLARKAERYKALSEELKAIELKVNKTEYSELKRVLLKTEAEYDSLKQEETSLRASISTLEGDYEKEKLESVEEEKQLNNLTEDFLSHERNVAEIQKQSAVLHSEKENIENNLTRLSSQLTELEDRIVGLHSKSSQLNTERNDLNAQLKNFSLSVSEKKEFISSIEQEIIEMENNVEDKRKNIFSVTESLSSLNNELTRLQSALDSMIKREEGYQKEIENIAVMTGNIDEQIIESDSLIADKTNEVSEGRTQKEALLQSVAETHEEIETLQSAISSLKEEIASDNSRLFSLQEITSDGLTTDLLNQTEELHISGVISDIISVDTRYEKAIEAALSEKINGFILSTFEDVELAVRFINENTFIRTAFMALENGPSEEPRIPLHEAVIGRAVKYVRTEDRFMPLIEKLLNNVVIVKELRNALELSKQYKGLNFVTPEGDVLDRSMTVLSGEGKGILKRKREIKELVEKIEKGRTRLKKEENTLGNLRETRHKKEQEIEGIEERIVSIEKDLSIHKVELQNLRQEKERLQKKKAFIQIEIEQTRQEKGDLLKTVHNLEKRISETIASRENVEKSLSSLQQDLSEKRDFYEQYRSDLTEIKLEMTSYKEKIDAVAKEIASIQELADESARKKEIMKSEVQQNQLHMKQKAADIDTLEEKVKDQIVLIDNLKTEISAKKDEMQSRAQRLNEKEYEIKSLRKQSEDTHEKLSSSDVARTECRLKMENIFNNVIQMYSVNIDQYETSPPSEEERENVANLRKKLHSIGPVNLDTIDEYEELKKRYEFLTAQQEDLTKSIEELEEAIKKINATTRKRLREAFDVLNEKFGEVFRHLFGGGTANLVLTDEQNILESGIDIISQPPGKKLQNISLLSGGEKALTAISLIFSGFLIKPAPMCILDEADAPLDDSNAGKYSAMLREFSKENQFIIITHNRTTMEIADYIYGITMEEPGVSKVISMQLAEA